MLRASERRYMMPFSLMMPCRAADAAYAEAYAVY